MINMATLAANFKADSLGTKYEMVQSAARELLTAVKNNYYELDDLQELNYPEVCGWLDWPDFQDGGIFEQSIDIAANQVLSLMGYKPCH